jgi:acetyl esterase/lipase
MGLLTSHPGKFIYTLLAVVFNTIRLPLWLLYYIPTGLRPHPAWTYRQAILVQIVKSFLWNASMVQVKTPLSLLPNAEKERWVVAEPASAPTYMGVANSDAEVKPEATGGTWYPARPGIGGFRAGYVVLHLHGGAYVIGDGRTKDAGFAAKMLIKNSDATHVFAPQYRLSSNPGCRFPAQLQDAITAYNYLISQENIAPQKIIISGDSAGANLALSLVKYITEHGSKTGLGEPLACWLWSPWVSPAGSLTSAGFDSSPNRSTDYVTSAFGTWGAKTLQPNAGSGLTLDHAYISFNDNAFATKTPLYISTGECEVLYHDDVKLYEQFKAIKGNKVDLQVEEHAVHDTILAGPLLGFEKEADVASKRAGEWLKKVIASKKA